MRSTFFMRYIIFFLFFFFLPLVSAETMITEIRFQDSEFVEIYSDERLWFNGSRVYDESGNERYNTLELLHKTNSSLYLIVGSNFEVDHDLSLLNCTIYLTERSQVSNGGLKDTGENFTIEINSSLNLSFSSHRMYDFAQNESLNLMGDSEVITDMTPCVRIKESGLGRGEDQDNLSLEQNQTLDTNTTISDACEGLFEIETGGNLFLDKISFSFDTDQKDFHNIEYWVEDFEGNIVKDKRNTTNLNEKSFTPEDFSNVYFIKSLFFFRNCTLNQSEQVFFYHKLDEGVSKGAEEVKEPQSRSYIFIKNQDDITRGYTKTMTYELYKGSDTRKRAVYFFLNSEKIHSHSLGKFDNITGKLELNFTPGLNHILISGLGLEVEFYVQDKKVENLVEKVIEKEKKDYFRLSDLVQIDSTVLFSIDTNIENITISCYVLEDKTQVSNQFDFEGFGYEEIIRLDINVSRLKEKEKNQLKLICKYKRSRNKTFDYESSEFSYELKKELDSQIDFSYISEAADRNLTLVNEISKQEIRPNSSRAYNSKNVRIKEDSLLSVFFGTFCLLCAFVLKWR